MKKVFLYSIEKSIPVLVSFLPVGIAYGILMQTIGYNWIWTAGTSFFVFAGSLQFLMVNFFAGGVSMVTVALMALLLNSRHIFYGIPFIEKWHDYGFWKYFLIYALPDESFSLHCDNDFDDGNERHKMFSYVITAALVFFYWVAFSILGTLIGTLINFDTSGIDFALTALFIVILIEQMRSAGNILPALIAFISAVLCLIFIGPSNFILPSLLITVVILLVFKAKIGEAKK